MTPGGSAESAVWNVAVHDAPITLPALSVVAPAGTQFCAEPRLAPPLRNCTVPVGPCDELLDEDTNAVNVTLPPEAMEVGLAATAAVVAAWVIVMERVLLLAGEV